MPSIGFILENPATIKIIELALLAIISFGLYLYAISRVRRYVAENDIPLQKAKSIENATRIVFLFGVIFTALNLLGAVQNIVLSTSIIGAVLILVSQSFLSSFISGVYLLIARPFNYGDRIQVGEHIGDVLEIGIISTKLKTPYNDIITIPNSRFLNTDIRNYDIYGSEVVVELEDISISYDSDLRKAKKIIIEIIKKFAGENPHVLAEPEPRVVTTRFGDSSISLKTRFYVDDVRVKGAVSSEIRDRIKEAFDKNGIVIPFPQRVIYVKK